MSLLYPHPDLVFLRKAELLQPDPKPGLTMKISASIIISTLFGAVVALSLAPAPRNFIYIVPDGYGTASQALARDYVSIQENKGTVNRPRTVQLGADLLVSLFLVSSIASCVS